MKDGKSSKSVFPLMTSSVRLALSHTGLVHHFQVLKFNMRCNLYIIVLDRLQEEMLSIDHLVSKNQDDAGQIEDGIGNR